MRQYFFLRFTIEGIPELDRILAVTHAKVSNFREPLGRAANLVLADVEQQFVTEGGLTGGWTPLAKSTVAGRMRIGYGGEHPILQRTGRLRGSFRADITSRKAVVTSRGVSYFKYHQSRLPRRQKANGGDWLPRRPMLVMPDRTRQNIQEEFNKFLRFK